MPSNPCAMRSFTWCAPGTQDMDGLAQGSRYRWDWRVDGGLVRGGYWPVVSSMAFVRNFAATPSPTPIISMGFAPREDQPIDPADCPPPLVLLGTGASFFANPQWNADSAFTLTWPWGLWVPDYEGLPMDLFAQAIKQGQSVGITFHCTWRWVPREATVRFA